MTPTDWPYSTRPYMTTPVRLTLPPDLLAELEEVATRTGMPVEELVARLLADELPEMVAEYTRQWLATTVAHAYPVDVPGDVRAIPERHPDTHITS